jgi:hypothetical protein|tara:strand:+ start:603 stop:797 length:195 start_codon:yes stop_codon:yes gene_type:complete
MNNLTKEEAKYVYDILIEKRNKLENTDSFFVLGVSLINQKEFNMVNKIMTKIYESYTIGIGKEK